MIFKAEIIVDKKWKIKKQIPKKQNLN